MSKHQIQCKHLLFEGINNFSQGLYFVDLVVYFYKMKTVLGLRSSFGRHLLYMFIHVCHLDPQDSVEDHLEYGLSCDSEDTCKEDEGEDMQNTVQTSEEVQELLHHHKQQIVHLRGKCESEVSARQNVEERLIQKQKEAKHWQMKHQYELKEKKKMVENLRKERGEREKLERQCLNMKKYCQQLKKAEVEVHNELYQMKKNVQKG